MSEEDHIQTLKGQEGPALPDDRGVTPCPWNDKA